MQNPFTLAVRMILIALPLLVGIPAPARFSSLPAAPADPGLRVQVTQRGDFVLLGNTFGHECAAGTPAPLVGVVGTCGINTADSAPDVFWRADSPAVGQAEANSSINPAQARSSAVLALPAGAQVTHAYLYWAATLSASGSDSTATLDRPGAGGFSQPVTAINTLSGPNNSYRSVADITALVQTQGAGAYRVSNVDIVNLVDLNNPTLFGAWWMVVLYEDSTNPLRTFTLSDGLTVYPKISRSQASQCQLGRLVRGWAWWPWRATVPGSAMPSCSIATRSRTARIRPTTSSTGRAAP